MNRLIIVFVIISLTGVVSCQNKNEEGIYLLISPYSPGGNNKSIAVYRFNNKTGEATLVSKIDDVMNASYLVVSPDRNHVYSTNEIGDGTVSSFSFNKATGELKFLNKVSSGGNGPTYITIDKKGRYLFCANYGSGSIGAIPVAKDGSVIADVQVFSHEPKPNATGRQRGPHAHATVISPDHLYVMVPDLGADKIYIYRFDDSKTSEPIDRGNPPFAEVKSGSGPRHLDFHPNGKYAYVIHELSGEMSVWDYNKGVLTEKQVVSMLAPDFEGSIGAADNHVSPDGRFLYGSNRGDANEIIVYKIEKDGTISLTGRQSTLGTGPRNFVIDPSGNFLLVGNNSSNSVKIFKIDRQTGMLEPTEYNIEITEPGCLKFITSD